MERYELGATIGEGCFGTVFLATLKETGEQVSYGNIGATTSEAEEKEPPVLFVARFVIAINESLQNIMSYNLSTTLFFR